MSRTRAGAGGDSTTQRGRVGEDRAVAELLRRGYTIVERNYRCRFGEIDIVARDGDALVFVEVRSRTRGDRGTALDTVSVRKQRQVARVAQQYLVARRPEYRHCRFDVVGITAGELTVVTDAFRLGEPGW